MNVIVYNKYTEELVRENNNLLFVFGDNLLRRGKAGQAVIRDEPNTFGIATKKYPSMNEDSFFTGVDEDFEAVHEDLRILALKLDRGDYQGVALPTGGLGTGLAGLQYRCPELLMYLNNSLLHIVNTRVNRSSTGEWLLGIEGTQFVNLPREQFD